ncbi:replication protein [Paenibacillus oleatilyticus]|uniref:Replication protein n=1 Tax=Paenibacillus oleatilyticus TaxID=2594886 RepID=A0ABV4VCF9_9BACL
MADVQPEHGYTKIADELLENIPLFKFNGTQLSIIMVVLRYTYGFQRKDHELSLSFFVNATGLGKTQVDREVKQLIEKNVLVVTRESTYTESRKLGLNKDYDTWKVENRKQKRVQSAKTLTVSENEYATVSENEYSTVSKNADQDIHYFINNIKNNTTTKEPYLILLEAFCELHNKFEYHLKRNERDAMRSMVSSGIPLDFVIESMKLVYEAKLSEGQPVTSFLYYDRVIPDIWEREKGGQADVEKHKRPSKVIQSGGHETQGKNKCGEGPLARSIMRRLEQERRDGPIVDQEFINSLPL